MLQLSGTLRNASSRLTPMSSWRMTGQQLIAACSGAVNPSPVLAQVKEEKASVRKPKVKNGRMPTSKNPMIQAAFDTLKVTKLGPTRLTDENPLIASKMTSINNVSGLLKIVDNKSVTPENAFAIVSLLIDWINNGKAKLSDFELDNRFLHLCELLSKSREVESRSVHRNEERTRRYQNELSLFYGMNEITEATKEVANITVSQMVKVMVALAHQKRRSTPLLRSLAFNISRSTEELNVKQLSDLLYSMAVLSYPDEVLLQKVTGELTHLVSPVENSAIIGSILMSIGILRYKNTELLDVLSEWVVKHSKDMRPQDMCAFFMTLAMLGYTPTNVELLRKVLIESITDEEMTKPAEWLDVVWALTVLQMVKNRHIASVLDCKFVRKLADSDEISVPKKQKLLNINGAAQLLAKNYTGPLLESNSEVFNSSIPRSKEKQTYARSVTTAVEHIFPSPEYVKLNVDYGMGFLVDAEFCTDSEGNRLPIDSKLEKNRGLRIAMISLCYNDFCRGKQDHLGFYNLYSRILEAKGYKVLFIPHTEFSAEDKIIHRVAYIINRIKSIAK